MVFQQGTRIGPCGQARSVRSASHGLNDKDVSMRVLVLGGTGMLGHKLWQVFSLQFDTFVSLRGLLCTSPLRALFASARTLENVSADEFATVDRALESCQPDVVVNAIGIVKQ